MQRACHSSGVCPGLGLVPALPFWGVAGCCSVWSHPWRLPGQPPPWGSGSSCSTLQASRVFPDFRCLLILWMWSCVLLHCSFSWLLVMWYILQIFFWKLRFLLLGIVCWYFCLFYFSLLISYLLMGIFIYYRNPKPFLGNLYSLCDLLEDKSNSLWRKDL